MSGFQSVANPGLTNNGTTQLAVVSYFVTSIAIKDTNYYPYPAKVSIHDNTFAGGGAAVDMNTQLGLLLLTGQSYFPDNRIPDVLYDGVTDPTITTPAENPMQLCIAQPGSHMANLHFDQLDAQGDNLDNIEVELIAPIAMEDGLRFAVREGGRTVGAGVVAKILE